MFFPYRARIKLYRFPVLTVVVSVLCLIIYLAQFFNQRSLYESTYSFCQLHEDREFKQALMKLTGSADLRACGQVMLRLYYSKNEKSDIAEMAQHLGRVPGVVNADLRTYYEEILTDAFRAFKRAAPRSLTDRLVYEPESWNVLRMLSASVSHGSWGHVVGNLLFFFAFAATVETLIGPVLYLGVLIALAIGTHVVYSLAMLGQPSPPPTLGLSGVVMGVIALFTYFIPKARISCFLWLIIFFRRFAIPAWILAVLYIGSDVYSQLTSDGTSRINLIAHLAGAAIGLTIGLIFFRAKRHWAQELVLEKE